MHTPRITAAAGAAVVAALAVAGCSGSTGSNATKGTSSQGPDGAVDSVAAGKTTTVAATKNLKTLTWYGDYRPVYSLDPVKNADYPEETILPNVCTSLLQYSSDYTLKPSIASSWKQTSPTSVVFTIRNGVKFSDGSTLTADDVVYSLRRNMTPSVASSFAGIYSRVKSIKKSASNKVIVTFTKPDAMFASGMATLGGAIVSKEYAEAKGKSFGTPKGGVLCAGPYKVKSYDGTHNLTLTKNPYYWDKKHEPKADTVKFVFPSDPNALVNAVEAGTIQGGFDIPASVIKPLSTSTKGSLYLGGQAASPKNVDLIPTSLTDGPLADVRVRRALSLAIDRQAVAKTVWAGAAHPLYAVAGPGLFGKSAKYYESTYDKLAIRADVARAKKLVKDAGATGKTIRFAYPTGVSYVSSFATYLQQIGQQIGLKFKLVGQPPSQFGSLFVDKGARSKVDLFFTINYLEFPSPAAMIQSYATPDGFQNYEGYHNPKVSSLIDQAIGTIDRAKRASLVNKAQKILAKDLPWIPVVSPSITLFQAKGITGAPISFSYTTSPWLASVGGK